MIRIEYPIPVDIAGQSVVVVKDVVASGVTEPYLGQQLRDHGARQVRFAALVDLPGRAEDGLRVRTTRRSPRPAGACSWDMASSTREGMGTFPSVGRRQRDGVTLRMPGNPSLSRDGCH